MEERIIPNASDVIAGKRKGLIAAHTRKLEKLEALRQPLTDALAALERYDIYDEGFGDYISTSVDWNHEVRFNIQDVHHFCELEPVVKALSILYGEPVIDDKTDEHERRYYFLRSNEEGKKTGPTLTILARLDDAPIAECEVVEVTEVVTRQEYVCK